MLKDNAINDIIRVEGGYVDDPSDSGVYDHLSALGAGGVGRV